MADLFTETYNPDVLSCLANLSNDEVFTPPEVANQVLDMLPDGIWEDPDATFLDPACKSGIFLREIAKRLITGLEGRIPDLDERLEHIYKKQLFGIATTELCSLLSRRSLYCSKYPNSRYSVVRFDTAEGNVRYRRTHHTWKNGRCVWCGAAKVNYDRDESLEQHAYEFIHPTNLEEIKEMKFDVIVGNPPYQLSDGGYRISASPIYQLFVEQAMKLDPRYLTMIIPARWFAGGKGLDSFRDKMLHDNRIRRIHDYPDANDCFSGVQIKGGICYFLWDRDNPGDCAVTTHVGGAIGETVERPLLESGFETFIRWNEAIPIINKMRSDNSFERLVSSRKPFGLETTFRGEAKGEIKLYQNGGIAYVDRGVIRKNNDLIDEWKVLIPRAGSGSDSFPHSILGDAFIGEPGTACTETYLTIGPFSDKQTCENVISYINTRLFRFLVLLKKPSQDATSKVYSFVPMQDFSHRWNDDLLRTIYGINDDEYEFVCSLIRPKDGD